VALLHDFVAHKLVSTEARHRADDLTQAFILYLLVNLFAQLYVGIVELQQVRHDSFFAEGILLTKLNDVGVR
jgi:hypothetical protein